MLSAFVVFALVVLGGYGLSTKEMERRIACTSPVNLDGNPFADGRSIKANPKYAQEIRSGAEGISDPTLKEKALKIADVGTFIWLETISSLGTLDEYLKTVNCNEILGIVLKNLRERRHCSNLPGGLPIGSINRYKSEFIDPLVKIIQKNPNAAVVAIIEPETLTEVIINSDLQSCAQVRLHYEEGIAYALKSLNLPNVAQYIDAGHGGILGWDENLKPGAAELAKVYKAAGSPANVRGFATNVAGYNAWSMNPGEFVGDLDSKDNRCQDEKRFVTYFGAALQSAGFPNHAIVDTSRNAIQGLRFEWGDWCNVNGAGFGVRPTSNTEHNLTDAFIWAKLGGESDGTSDPNSYDYDSFCGKSDAFPVAPAYGEWNQAYFEMLVKNAKPSF